jgi:tripartite-type tricarboxylate transporter receptor subunit TctC
VAITQGITAPSVIVVHPSLPVKSMKDLIALAKARPGKLNFGANTGSPNHLAIELLNVSNNIKIVHVPYKGAGPVVTDVMAGPRGGGGGGGPPALPMVQAGRLRAIAQTGLRRSGQLPDLPTVAESGVPGYDVTSWYGFFAPARTPAAVISRLNADIVAVLRMPEVNKRLVALGADVVPNSPEEFGRFVRDEIQKWAKVVKASGAKAE